MQTPPPPLLPLLLLLLLLARAGQALPSPDVAFDVTASGTLAASPASFGGKVLGVQAQGGALSSTVGPNDLGTSRQTAFDTQTGGYAALSFDGTVSGAKIPLGSAVTWTAEAGCGYTADACVCYRRCPAGFERYGDGSACQQTADNDVKCDLGCGHTTATTCAEEANEWTVDLWTTYRAAAAYDSHDSTLAALWAETAAPYAAGPWAPGSPLPAGSGNNRGNGLQFSAIGVSVGMPGLPDGRLGLVTPAGALGTCAPTGSTMHAVTDSSGGFFSIIDDARAGNWFRLTIVQVQPDFDAANGRIDFYVDGIKQGSVACALPPQSGIGVIGAHAGHDESGTFSGTGPFGLLSDVRMYFRALTPDQIATLVRSSGEGLGGCGAPAADSELAQGRAARMHPAATSGVEDGCTYHLLPRLASDPSAVCVCELRCPEGMRRYGEGLHCEGISDPTVLCDLGYCHGNDGGGMPPCATGSTAGTADLAVDDETESGVSTVAVSGSPSSTQRPWFRVDLGVSFVVRSVTVTAGTAADVSEFFVRVGDDPSGPCSTCVVSLALTGCSSWGASAHRDRYSNREGAETCSFIMGRETTVSQPFRYRTAYHQVPLEYWLEIDLAAQSTVTRIETLVLADPSYTPGTSVLGGETGFSGLRIQVQDPSSGVWTNRYESEYMWGRYGRDASYTTLATGFEFGVWNQHILDAASATSRVRLRFGFADQLSDSCVTFHGLKIYGSARGSGSSSSSAAPNAVCGGRSDHGSYAGYS